MENLVFTATLSVNRCSVSLYMFFLLLAISLPRVEDNLTYLSFIKSPVALHCLVEVHNPVNQARRLSNLAEDVLSLD